MDERLNEINIGVFEDATLEEIEEKYPAELGAYRARNADFRFPEGESGDEAKKRAVTGRSQFLNRLAKQIQDAQQ